MANKPLAVIIVGFLAVLVGLSFWTLLGDNVGTLANLQTTANGSFTVPAQNAVADVVACGQQNTSAVLVFNATGDVEYPAANYTVAQGTSATDGYLVTQINFTGTFAGEDHAGTTATIDCTYQPRGYVTEGGTRAIVVLIPIFMALAIAFAASPDLREWLKGVVNR